MAEIPSAVILQRLCPAYRIPFFKALSESKRVNFTVVFGQAPAASALETEAGFDGIRCVRVRNSFLPLAGKDLACWQNGVPTLISGQQPDVVIAEFNPRILSNLYSYVFGRYRKFLWWGHGFGPNCNAVMKKIRLSLVRGADGLILYGKTQAERFLSAGISSDKLFVAPNSIDLTEISTLAEPWAEARVDCSAPSRTDILYIGRLIAEKKVRLLLDGFAVACRKGFITPETRLVIIGDGPLKSALSEAAGVLGIAERVHFAGALYGQKDLAPWFNRSWVSVSPGGVGLSAIHSLAYGVPMAVARGEGHGPEADDLIEGENAVFFDQESPDALAQTLADLQQSTGLAARLGQVGQEYVNHHLGINNMVTAFENAVLSVLNKC